MTLIQNATPSDHHFDITALMGWDWLASKVLLPSAFRRRIAKKLLSKCWKVPTDVEIVPNSYSFSLPNGSVWSIMNRQGRTKRAG